MLREESLLVVHVALHCVGHLLGNQHHLSLIKLTHTNPAAAAIAPVGPLLVVPLQHLPQVQLSLPVHIQQAAALGEPSQHGRITTYSVDQDHH